MKTNVYNLIILDESGSMASIHKAAVDGLNETLQSIQSAQKQHVDSQNHFVSIVFFNSDEVRTLAENKPIHEIALLKMKDFNPTSCTPLYDAMGNCLTKLRYQLDKNETHQVLVTIITDGYENASKEYSASMIRNLVNDLKSIGWVFAYIGANQDVESVAESISIENRLSFQADDKGSRKMSKKLAKSRMRFYDKIAERDPKGDINLQQGFFNEN